MILHCFIIVYLIQFNDLQHFEHVFRAQLEKRQLTILANRSERRRCHSGNLDCNKLQMVNGAYNHFPRRLTKT